VLRIRRHETVSLNTGGSLDLKGSEVLWTSGPRSRGIVLGVIALLFMIGALADFVGGHTSPIGSLLFAAVAGLFALRQMWRFLLKKVTTKDWELLLRSPQRRLIVREVVYRSAPQPNETLRALNVAGPTTRHEAWREVSVLEASHWLQQRSQSAAEKLFPELAAQAQRQRG